MSFLEGVILIHPAHGPMRIQTTHDRVVRGASRRYVELEALNARLSLAVPEDNVFAVGLRNIATRERIDEILAVLSAPSETHSLTWAGRLKDYQARLATGEINALCEVVREIYRSGKKSPASAEGQVLRRAMATLTLEVSLAMQISTDDATEMIERATGADDLALQLTA